MNNLIFYELEKVDSCETFRQYRYHPESAYTSHVVHYNAVC